MSIETQEPSITQQVIDELEIAPPTDFEALYNEKTAEVERLEAVIAASRIATSAPANKSGRPPITADRLRAMVGELAFQKMTRTERLVSLGIDPATPNEVFKRGWGRSNDGRFAQDLSKSDPRKYGLLKEGAKALDIFGN